MTPRQKAHAALLAFGLRPEAVEGVLRSIERVAVRKRERELAQIARDTGTNDLIRFAEVIEGRAES